MNRMALGACLAGIVLLAPVLAAASTSGTGYGVLVGWHSAGKWEYVEATVEQGGTVDLTLTWESSPTPADFDFTVYEEAAADDGALTDDEVIARAWTWGFSGPEHVSIHLDPGTYPVTIEPIQATGNAWTLEAQGAVLQPWDTVIIGTKITEP